MYHLGELYHKLLPIRSQLNPDIYWNVMSITMRFFCVSDFDSILFSFPINSIGILLNYGMG